MTVVTRDLTWDEDLQPLIEGLLPRDAVTEVSAYKRLANLSVALINVQAGGFDSYWNNDPNDTDSGTLTLSGNHCRFPRDLLEARLDGVYWNGTRLHYQTHEQLTSISSSWHTRSGVPSYFTFVTDGLMLDADPGVYSGGELEIWGIGCMPDFADGPDAVNPLTYLPGPQQWAPAFYVLGYVPLWERATEAILAIQSDYRDQWTFMLGSVTWAVKVRKFPPMSS